MLCFIYIMYMSFIIFTDLDGTLLSYNDYSFNEALDALMYIKEIIFHVSLQQAKPLRKRWLYKRC